MYYVFNKENKCICTSDNRLNEEDLKSREEYCVESDLILKCSEVADYDGKAIVAKIVEVSKEERLKALDTTYNAELVKLANEWNIANMDGDKETMDIIKLEREDLKTKYEADKIAIESEYQSK